MTDLDHITQLGASDLSRAIHERKVSCQEVMRAYLARIARINPVYNALVSLGSDEQLLAQACSCDDELARGYSRGWLHGVPMAVKDTSEAAGYPCTLGSPLLAGRVAARDSVMAGRLRGAGAIFIGKTNVPEFGLGSHTFNTVYGTTRNAWDAGVSAGGSSGGGAAALALRLLPVADGSDFMGSLRNPAAWNHVFGLRPSQGRVPTGPGADIWVSQLATEGPMARSVEDLYRLLVTQSGYDPRVPLSLGTALDSTPPASAGESLKEIRIGWLGDLGGHLALEPGVLAVCEQALHRMSVAGAKVDVLSLGVDLDSIWDCWLVWRSALVGGRLASLLRQPGAREVTKFEALWEHDRGRDISVANFVQASEIRSAFYQHLLRLFDDFDVLALPTAQVWPFACEMRWPQSIGTRSMDTYHRWMEVTIYATLAGLPAVSVPAGFDESGQWPMGLQLIGRPRSDQELLSVAAAYESINGELLSRIPLGAGGRVDAPVARKIAPSL